MSDYKKYEVKRTGPGKYEVNEKEPTTFGEVVTFIISIVIVLCLLRSCVKETPNSDGNYQIKSNQTAYVLQTGYEELSGHYEKNPQYISTYSNGWVEDYSETSIRINGNFRRITGTIAPPKTCKGYKCDGNYPILDYWRSEPLRAKDTQTLIQQLKNLASSRNSFTVRIYGDGRLLYTSPIMLQQNAPVSFNVNVTGVQEITFRWSYIYLTYFYDYGRSEIYLSSLTGHTN